MEEVCKLIENSKVLHPVAKAAQIDSRYWRDFLDVMRDYKAVLNESQFKSFLEKSQLDQYILLPQYVQFASEACVVDYIIRKYKDGFSYEPKYEGKKNPECSFKYNGRIVNVEVKTPDLMKRIKQENNDGVKIYCAERLPDKADVDKVSTFIGNRLGEKINRVDRLDNKLKDYLVSANKKFPKTGEEYFNILVIALDIIQDMDEWYSYIFGNTGVFTKASYVEEEYNNVDAILLTNIQHGHMTDDVMTDINCWDLQNYVSLLFLNPQKEHTNGFGEYYFKYTVDIFGFCTRDFLVYQRELDRQSDLYSSYIDSETCSENERSIYRKALYLNEKLVDMSIISEWCKKQGATS